MVGDDVKNLAGSFAKDALFKHFKENSKNPEAFALLEQGLPIAQKMYSGKFNSQYFDLYQKKIAENGSMSPEEIKAQFSDAGQQLPDDKIVSSIAAAVPAGVNLFSKSASGAVSATPYGAIVSGIIQFSNSPAGQKILNDPGGWARKIADATNPVDIFRRDLNLVTKTMQNRQLAAIQHKIAVLKAQGYNDKQIAFKVRMDQENQNQSAWGKLKGAFGLTAGGEEGVVGEEKMTEEKKSDHTKLKYAKTIILVLFVVAFIAYMILEIPELRSVILFLGTVYIGIFLYCKFSIVRDNITI